MCVHEHTAASTQYIIYTTHVIIVTMSCSIWCHLLVQKEHQCWRWWCETNLLLIIMTDIIRVLGQELVCKPLHWLILGYCADNACVIVTQPVPLRCDPCFLSSWTCSCCRSSLAFLILSSNVEVNFFSWKNFLFHSLSATTTHCRWLHQ